MPTTGTTSTLTAEEIGRAADYVQLIFEGRYDAAARAAVQEFHRDERALARLMCDFGELLLREHITVFPAGEDHACVHAEDAEYALTNLTEVVVRYFKWWCLGGGGAPVAAGFLIECMQEEGGHTLQILSDVRQAADPAWRTAPAAWRGHGLGADVPPHRAS
ncbi:hypothetical protein [Streptomyces sp. NPDC091027]|uniref:hypothetical protein n=1 Tax=Streptomyces sp. NPDC091027 TaxID=3365971 RepID=UPI0038018A5E